MSNLAIATRGYFCENVPVSIATRGYFCNLDDVVTVRNNKGAVTLDYKPLKHPQLLHEEDEEIILMCMAFMEIIE